MKNLRDLEAVKLVIKRGLEEGLTQGLTGEIITLVINLLVPGEAKLSGEGVHITLLNHHLSTRDEETRKPDTIEDY